ncbi:unnamed protein product, partial [Vitis vinifera]
MFIDDQSNKTKINCFNIFFIHI